jgi:branched-chain amino acid transport system permease protein
LSYYIGSLLIIACIQGILALGLNVRYGWAGDFDLSFYAFVAMGAYVTAVITLPRPDPSVYPPPEGYILGLSLPFLVGVAGAMIAAAVTSAAVGAIALRRLRSDYFSIVTISATLLAYQVVSDVIPLFNGQTGLFGLSQPFNSVLKLDQNTYEYFYLGICLVALVVTYVVLEGLYRSPFGRSLRAIREDEKAASAFGRNVYVYKLKAFVIGGVTAGLGGALLAHYLGGFNPDTWNPIETVFVYAALFVGGSGNNRGMILGVLLVTILFQEVARFIPEIPGHPGAVPALHNIAVGLLILVVLRFRPQGILPEPRPRDSVRGSGATPLLMPSHGE